MVKGRKIPERMKKMRKYISVFMLAIAILGLTACGRNFETPVSCKVFSENILQGTRTEILIDLTEDAQNEVVRIMKRADWVNDVTDCAHDVEFAVPGRTVRYHSECGTLIDIEKQSSAQLSEEDKQMLDGIIEFDENSVSDAEN